MTFYEQQEMNSKDLRHMHLVWQFQMKHTHSHYKTLVKMAFKILKNGLRIIDLRNLEKHGAEDLINIQGPSNTLFFWKII